MMRAYRRAMSRFAASRAGASFFHFLLPRVDRITLKLTKGRRVFTNHAIPTLLLTTTGRKSGEPRTQPLCYVKDGLSWVVVGSNWGQDHHPAWTANLLADPRGSVAVDGLAASVTAEPVTGDDWERLYRRFEEMSINYASYRRWAVNRAIRMFRLSPARPGDGQPMSNHAL